MVRYVGYRRQERISDMAKTVNVYGGSKLCVSPEPIRVRDIVRRIDREPEDQGGQGYFHLLKGSDGRLAVKLFKVSGTDSDVLRERARRVGNALRILSTIPPSSDFKSFVLFNQLNIPKCYIASDDGRLVGLVVPVAPRSCYTSALISGRSASKPVLLRHVVYDQHFIHPKRNSDDPLVDAAKWSLLDSLCQTIASMHELHLIHGDLSSNNVLVRWAESHDPKVYVIDAFNGFGDTGGNRELKYMYNDVFCPLSVRRGEYTTATDVYCLAWWVMHIAVAANPVAMRLPVPTFSDVSDGKDSVFIRHRYVVDSLPSARRMLPKWLFDLLSVCLDDEPRDRPDARELAYAVHDYWKSFGDER